MTRIQLWVPWLIVGAIQGVALGLLWWFAHPSVSHFMVPLVHAVGGESALHYPDIFSHMPALFARADMLIVASLGAVMLGASSRLFADAHTHSPLDPVNALWGASMRAITLVVVMLPFNVLLALMSQGLAIVLGSQGSLIQQAGYVLSLGASLVLQAMFLYVTQVATLERRGIRGTFGALSRTWRHGLLAGVLLGGLTLLPLLPLHFLSGQTAKIVQRGSPDLIGVMVLAQLLVALAAGFVLNGSATLVYLSSMTRREEMER